MAKQLRLAAAAARLIQVLRRPSRYAQIGLLCALLSNALVIGLDQAGFHYLVSAASAGIAATVVGYLLHSAYTFKVPASRATLLRFLGATALGFWLSILLMIILCDGFALSASVAMPIATVLLFAYNFVLATWAITGGGLARRSNAAIARRR